MGLVDYSDSESDSEAQPSVSVPAPKPKQQPAPSNASQTKKPFQKLLDRSNPGQIRVSLPSAEQPEPSDEPPAKRPRTAGQSAFADFNSFLPAPKKPNAAPARAGASKPVGLKTSSDAAFERRQDDDQTSLPGAGGGSGLSLPPPRNGSSGSNPNRGVAGASEPGTQKPADEVKLIGKPLMFKPLSVARRPGDKKKTSTTAPKITPTPTPSVPETTEETKTPQKPAPAPKPPKKPAVSLFSFEDPADDPPAPAPAPAHPTAYEPLIATDHSEVTGPYESSSIAPPTYYAPNAPPAAAPADSLDAIADSMNLTPAQRRELFGRGGPPASLGGGKVQSVVNVNMGREYAANEALRASGEVVQHNPLRSIQPGKHSLKQLVNAVQNQRDALEESFAKGKSNQREAAGRYGWK